MKLLFFNPRMLKEILLTLYLQALKPHFVKLEFFMLVVIVIIKSDVPF